MDLFQAINPHFVLLNDSTFAKAKKDNRPTAIHTTPGIQIHNIYFMQKIAGTLPTIFARKIVKEMVDEALTKLPEGYGFCIYDIFRTLETQKALFLQYKDEFAKKNPQWDEDKLIRETKKFVPLPGAADAPSVMPHNSGGAVDLTLTFDNTPCDMGTPFDDSSLQSAPDFFERERPSHTTHSLSQWEEVRNKRRILFNAMTSVGFVVHPYEWWHFNFGNASWATLAKREALFGSMEEDWGKFWE